MPFLFLDNFLTIFVLLSLLAACMPQVERKEKYLFWNFVIQGALLVATKWVIPALRKRKYTSGEYGLGEIYRRMVLGENINTRDDRVVGDAAVDLAEIVFTSGFGIVVGSADHYAAIRDKDFPRYKAILTGSGYGTYANSVTQAQWDRAVALQSVYFVNKNTPIPATWDLTKFATIPLLGPIPDPNNPNKLLSAELPGGQFVEKGWPVLPTAQAAQQNAVHEDQPAPGSVAAAIDNPITPWLLGAGALGLFYFLSRKKSRA